MAPYDSQTTKMISNASSKKRTRNDCEGNHDGGQFAGSPGPPNRRSDDAIGNANRALVTGITFARYERKIVSAPKFNAKKNGGGRQFDQAVNPEGGDGQVLRMAPVCCEDNEGVWACTSPRAAPNVSSRFGMPVPNAFAHACFRYLAQCIFGDCHRFTMVTATVIINLTIVSDTMA
jgi:hypothetical protein